MVETKAIVKNKVGFHSRPATRVREEAMKYKSKISLIYNNQEVNAKSVIEMITLAIPPGAEVIIRAEGEDEKEAVEAILKLFEAKFYEE